MNLDPFQAAWKSDGAQMQVTVDTDLLSKEVQSSYQSFQSSIFWRDVREAGASLVMIPFWLVMGTLLSLPWTWYLTIPAFVWVTGFILFDRRRHPQRPSPPGEPLLFYVKESLTQLDHQIWLLRNVFWWYLLPFCISLMAFFIDTAWSTTGHWMGGVCFGGFLALFLGVIYGGVYRMNQWVVRQQFEPRRQDLLKLVASLEGESTHEDAGDIMELVAAVSTPMKNVGLSPGWERWSENWNRIIRSWRTVAVIVVPTLIGGLCGYVSGAWLQIPEMGPTFFQTVVGAVLPNEILFFWFWWRSTKKPRVASESEPSGSDSTADVNKPASEQLKRLPRAPAIVILVLILFLSVMAFAAVLSAMRHFRRGSDSRDAQRLSEPNLMSGVALSEAHLVSIDAWLQAQVDLAEYPSLTAGIVLKPIGTNLSKPASKAVNE